MISMLFLILKIVGIIGLWIVALFIFALVAMAIDKILKDGLFKSILTLIATTLFVIASVAAFSISKILWYYNLIQILNL